MLKTKILKIKNWTLVPFALAATSQEGWKVPEVPGLSSQPVDKIMLTFISWAITIIGVLAVIIFIYGGFLYLTAQGETNKIDQAKRVITYAIVGIAVSVLGLVAVTTVDKIMNANSPISTGGSGAPTSTPAGPGPGGSYASPVPGGPGGNPPSDVPTSLPQAPLQ